MLVKSHSEDDLRVDPTNPAHLIGSSTSGSASTRSTTARRAAHLCAACVTTFIGDYFGNVVAPARGRSINYATFVSTYDYGGNSAHHQRCTPRPGTCHHDRRRS
jgi:hypothetical protein